MKCAIVYCEIGVIQMSLKIQQIKNSKIYSTQYCSAHSVVINCVAAAKNSTV